MYAVMRFAKLKNMGQIKALGTHNERERETRNADEARRGDNVRLAGTGDWCADVQARLDTVPTIRANAVLALEYVMTASKEFYAQGDESERSARLDAWMERNMGWLRERFGAENVVAAVLHKDELTPHVQAVVVPINDAGRLSATHYVDGAEKLHEMQTSYARAVEDLGLVRGVQGSVATHQTVQEYYAKIQEPTPAPEIVRQHLEVERPGRLVANPERWASEQHEKIAERITPALDAALTKATHYEEQAAKAEANNLVLQQRVREVERERDTLQRDYT
ncbi:MAG: plasmid recombination protein, partial [Chloroflexota bacterium]|nr:plasmid recombination protein [Chloroflexota bacterium]